MADSPILPAAPDRWMEGKWAILLTGLALTALVTLISLFQPNFLHKADLFVYDQLLASRAVPAQSADPVLVAIDEASLAAYGQWPWPRYRLAMLVERLHAQGARVIALDFLMPEPDRTSPEVILRERLRDQVDAPALPATGNADSNSQRLPQPWPKGRASSAISSISPTVRRATSRPILPPRRTAWWLPAWPVIPSCRRCRAAPCAACRN